MMFMFGGLTYFLIPRLAWGWKSYFWFNISLNLMNSRLYRALCAFAGAWSVLNRRCIAKFQIAKKMDENIFYHRLKKKKNFENFD